jgi:uncharacterized DUF497 family protein
MQFEWDPRKAKENQKKHHVSFDEAVTVSTTRFQPPLMILTIQLKNNAT